MKRIKPPVHYRGNYRGTDGNGNEHYGPPYYDPKEVQAYIERVQQLESSMLGLKSVITELRAESKRINDFNIIHRFALMDCVERLEQAMEKGHA